MNTSAPPIDERGTAQIALTSAAANHVSPRRLRQRRQVFAIHAVGYTLTTAVLLVYWRAGTVPIEIATGYLLAGLALTGMFVILSENGVNDRFRDHHLTIVQVLGHILLQLGFIAAAPQIGVAFLSRLFVAFGFGALGMTSLHSVIAWMVTTVGVAVVLLIAGGPIALPMSTPTESIATILVLALTLGQCAVVGRFGYAMREQIYRRTVELKEANRRIEELAGLDELTGAFNRRCILRMLDDEIARSARAGTPCAIALIDLDWFKRVNDAFGHPTGDEVLRTFAITIFANIRAIDRFGRYGGEEFLLVLPDTGGDGAARNVDRLRRIIADLDWSAFSPDMKVTISAGVAALIPHELPDALLGRADRALYAAKHHGRNRVSLA